MYYKERMLKRSVFLTNWNVYYPLLNYSLKSNNGIWNNKKLCSVPELFFFLTLAVPEQAYHLNDMLDREIMQ